MNEYSYQRVHVIKKLHEKPRTAFIQLCQWECNQRQGEYNLQWRTLWTSSYYTTHCCVNKHIRRGIYTEAGYRGWRRVWSFQLLVAVTGFMCVCAANSIGYRRESHSASFTTHWSVHLAMLCDHRFLKVNGNYESKITGHNGLSREKHDALLYRSDTRVLEYRSDIRYLLSLYVIMMYRGEQFAEGSND